MKSISSVYKLVVLVIMLFVILFVTYELKFKKDKEVISISDETPNFVLRDLKGVRVSFDSFKGKPIVLNFWGSWCEPCRNEMPLLDKLYSRSKDINFVTVNMDDNEISVTSYMEKAGLKLPVLLDKDKEVARLYGVNALPTTFFINKFGTIKIIHKGELTESILLKSVTSL